MIKIVVDKFDNNQTLISFLKKNLYNVSLSLIFKLIRTGNVAINGHIIKDSAYNLKNNDSIQVNSINENNIRTKKISNEIKSKSANHKINVAYQDSDILIVNKPYGVVTSSDKQDSLSSSVINQFSSKDNSSYIISAIHRLDKVAQGLVIYAKDRLSFIKISEYLKQGRIQKKYRVKIEKPILKNLKMEGYICVQSGKSIFYKISHCENCKSCITFIEKSFYKNNSFYSDIEIKNGRKHQIRATLSFLKNPIIGDRRYGSLKKSKVYLICYQITIPGKKTITLNI
jgi:23S rRNA pseudouridine955/2504/2580 synthase